MLRVNQVKVHSGAGIKDIQDKTAQILHIKPSDILSFKIVRESIDARKKPEISLTYSVDVSVKNETSILKRWKGKENMVSASDTVKYDFLPTGTNSLKNPPVIVGMGPAGLYCAYYLARYGYRPVLIERGKAVEERQKDVEQFWNGGKLDPESNVQFGEGGAGTFSDGKLNTLVKDKYGRNLEVLETLVKFGAKPSICYEAKPHIGTDVLAKVVENMRKEIIRLGGKVYFESKLTDIICENDVVKAIEINHNIRMDCEQLVLAIGHSARDTFDMLYAKQIPMEAKPFAVGLRVEHPQSMINESQYGSQDTGNLGAASYKVTAKASNGRSVYSFCMCPGGYVVNASSEEGRTAVNGMSYSGRNGANANSAIIVAVTPEDYPSEHPLSGIAFQRSLEEKAYEIGKGKIPVQRFTDFEAKVTGIPAVDVGNSELMPQTKGGYVWANVDEILPKACKEAFVDGMHQFGRQIKGFDRPDSILLGIESRTSSPVRIQRDENFQTKIAGIYPCGEGAGYAGGITSAAMDGLRVFEAIASSFAPYKEDQPVT